MLIKIIALSVLIISLLVACIAKRKSQKIEFFVPLGLVIYLVLLVWFTLIDRGNADASFCLIPFSSYCQILQVRWYGWGEYIFRQIVGNVILFFPLGIMIGLIDRLNKKMLVSVITGILLSFCVELTQLIFMLGSFEVDDIINNTWGAAIGCGVAILLQNKEKRKCDILTALLPLFSYLLMILSFCIVPITKELMRVMK